MPYALVLVILLPFLAPVFQTSEATCAPSSETTPVFTWDYQSATRYDDLVMQMTTYLNSGAEPTDLPAALTATIGNEYAVATDLIVSDFTGDGAVDLMVQFHLDYGAGYEYVLALFTCAAGQYQPLDSRAEGISGSSATQIITAVDLNNNQRRDLLISREVLNGMKGFTELVIYEWDGAQLTKNVLAPERYEGYGTVQISNLNDDPTTLEMTIPSSFAYESGTATAYIEYSNYREIRYQYAWDGADYALTCTYFTDDETNFLVYRLHNAEMLRACGWYEAAAELYYDLAGINMVELDTWDNGYHQAPWLQYPGNFSDAEKYQYAAKVERAYYQTFALYRLIQLTLAGHLDVYDTEDMVEGYIEFMAEYTPGTHGYVYKAMSMALFEAYQASDGDLRAGCVAAQEAFESAYASGDDPGLGYGDPFFGFYYGGGGYNFGANPDNLFEVPENIAYMISTPVCLM